jgi:uncharacterized protein (DUF3084 family)
MTAIAGMALNAAERIALLESALEQSARDNEALSRATEDQRLDVEVAHQRLADAESERAELQDDLRVALRDLGDFTEERAHIHWNRMTNQYVVVRTFKQAFTNHSDAMRLARDLRAARMEAAVFRALDEPQPAGRASPDSTGA